MTFCSSCGTKIDDGAKFCPSCGKNVNSSSNEAIASTDQHQGKKWWENYSPIPHEQVPATLRATLTPKEVVVAISKIHKIPYILAIVGFISVFVATAFSMWLFYDSSWIDEAFFIIALVITGVFCLIAFLIRRAILRRTVMVVTDQRFLGSHNAKVFSTDKLDLPLRSVDSFGVDDTFFGNIFGYTKIKMLSRSSTYYFSWVTRVSCQTLKNAYYDWDAKQSK